MGSIVCVVSFLLVSADAANPLARAKGTVSINYIGEGGGYTHPDPAAGGHLEREIREETGATRGEGPAPAPRRYENWTPSKPPAERVAAEAPPKVAASAPIPAPAESKPEAPPRYSLWEGLAAPLKLPAAKVSDTPAEESRGLADQDYETHVLGHKRKEDTAEGRLLAEAPQASGASETPSMFVAVDFEVKDGELKDAVAGLAGGAGFRQDPRFEPAAEGGRVSVWGWLSPEKLGAAMRSRGVARLRIDGKPRRGRFEGAATEVLLGIRLSEAGAAGPIEAKTLAELSRQTGYRHLRTLGVQYAPGTKAPVLVLSGEVPVRELSRLMGRPDVVKLVPSPAPLAPEPRPAPAPAPGPTGLKAFAAYAASRSPILLVVTLLMMVPSVGLGLLKAAEVFIPYRR